MTTRPVTPCRSPGCPGLIQGGGYCPACRARGMGASWRGSRRAAGLPPGWAQTRLAILRRDGFACATPGCPYAADQVDHITPASRGGSDDPTNLQSLCTPCHRRKSAREGRAAR